MINILEVEKYLSGKIVDEIELDDPNPTKETIDRMARLCDRLRKIKRIKEELNNG